ncbi:2-hydroxyacid dehydrogenase [Alkalihalobacillus trypoxylicola]|uniref:Glyoxylate/hydroxypyruvate reductase B n=1 Tax=Alkalihalobacillus trypoxylicola TaxID=519424 RepID=A0A161P7K3_9BACI|nr:D-glycerate dehydrogenase [Alkalihalobacillus trypoxylicola]KYG26628.1 D-glycerate dehydrogenase [Alkalihalobacillus trypoxylicola]
MKILVTRKLPKEMIKPLYEIPDSTVVMFDQEEIPMPKKDLLKEIRNADGILANLTDDLNREVLKEAKQLKVISTMAVGYDNIDMEEAEKRGIKVGHTPYVLTEATADLTFALLLSVSRNLPQAASIVKNNQWKSWSPFSYTGHQVHGATIGIIGMGRIGLSVARRAKGFSMKVLYHNRSRHIESENEVGAIYCEDIDTLLAQSDYVVLLVPGSKQTTHMFGEEQFKKMKNKAYFINTSRGTNVDEQALFHALKEGEIKGAGLDVFESEPIQGDHPLLELDNVLALPHIGSASIETRTEMAELTVTNLKNGLTGKPLVYEVQYN